MVDIPYGRELLVWYGNTYAEEMGIDIATVDKYKGEEDHTEEAIKCEYYGGGMEGGKELEEHLGKGDGRQYSCRVKQAMEMVSMAESGERKFVCKVCGKGFKRKLELSANGTVHTKVKSFKCDVEGCTKSYSDRSSLDLHKKSVHEGIYNECPECERRFGKKSDMTTHYKTVQEEEKHY